MGYIATINTVKDAIYDLINSGGIKNLRNFNLTVYKRGLPKGNISKENCPLASVFKKVTSGNSILTDQPDLELPRNISIIIGLADYSMIDLDDAEKYTDDLLDKIITQLNTDPSLSGKSKGIIVRNITWDEDRDTGIWFSMPVMELEVVGEEL